MRPGSYLGTLKIIRILAVIKMLRVRLLLPTPLLLRLRPLGCPSWGLRLPMQLRLLPLVP